MQTNQQEIYVAVFISKQKVKTSNNIFLSTYIAMLWTYNESKEWAWKKHEWNWMDCRVLTMGACFLSEFVNPIVLYLSSAFKLCGLSWCVNELHAARSISMLSFLAICQLLAVTDAQLVKQIITQRIITHRQPIELVPRGISWSAHSFETGNHLCWAWSAYNTLLPKIP